MMKYLVLFFLALTLSTPAMAEKFISLAVSETTSDGGPGAFGVGFAETDAKADEIAMNDCRKAKGTSCQIVEQQKGGCVAVAAATSASHDGLGLEQNEHAAIEEAMRNCRQGGKYSGCSITHNNCFD